MYKFVGKKGQLYKFNPDEIIMKLNWKCPKGTIDDTFKCGNTPAEAKKNYNRIQKEKRANERDKKRTKDATKKTKTAEKQIKKISNPELKVQIDNVKSIIDKVKSEKKSGKVSKETFKQLKLVTKDLRNAVKTPIQKSVNISNSKLLDKQKLIDSHKNIATIEKTALQNYTEFDYSAINKIMANRPLNKRDFDYIPNDRGNTKEEKTIYVKKAINTIKNAFNKNPISQDVVSYRGISESALKRLNDTGGMIIGSIINIKTFSSTTLTLDKAKEFSITKDKPTVIKYIIPKGSNAIYVDDFSKFSGEEELLVDNSKFKVVGVQDDDDVRIISWKMMETK